MKNIIILIIAFLCLFFSIKESNILKKTRYGQRQESIESLSASELPPILARYLGERYAKYELYRIPNYIKDLLLSNSDFKKIYEIKPIYTIVLFAPIDEKSQQYKDFYLFYETLQNEVKLYPKSFDILFSYENKSNDMYKNTYDNEAYKDFIYYCRNVCIIDPSRNTMFSFKNLGVAERDSLPVVLQQYSFMLK